MASRGPLTLCTALVALMAALGPDNVDAFKTNDFKVRLVMEHNLGLTCWLMAAVLLRFGTCPQPAHEVPLTLLVIRM